MKNKTYLNESVKNGYLLKWHKMPTFGHTKQLNEKYESPL